MFVKTPAGYRQMTATFARNIEDVEGPDALWVRAAALYIRIMRENPPNKRRQAFILARKTLLTRQNDSDAKAIASDIERYLKETSARQHR
jgi:hypothetical protein